MKAVRLVAVWNASAVEGWYTTEKKDYEVGTRLQIWKSAHIFNVFFAHLENGGRFFSTKLPNPVARALVFCLGISAFRTHCDDVDVKNIEFDQLDSLHDFFAQFR